MKFNCTGCGRPINTTNPFKIVEIGQVVECAECGERIEKWHDLEMYNFCHPPCTPPFGENPQRFVWDKTIMDRKIGQLEDAGLFVEHLLKLKTYFETIAQHNPRSGISTVPDELFFTSPCRANQNVIIVSKKERDRFTMEMWEQRKYEIFLDAEIVDCLTKVKDWFLVNHPEWRRYPDDRVLWGIMSSYEAPFFAKVVPLWMEEGRVYVRNQTKVIFGQTTGHADLIGGDESKIFIYAYIPFSEVKQKDWIYYAPRLITQGVMLLERVPDLKEMYKENLLHIELGFFNFMGLIVFPLDFMFTLVEWFGNVFCEG
jgi:DNA-directed RNA polymerase subunit RPC12/RpoP